MCARVSNRIAGARRYSPNLNTPRERRRGGWAGGPLVALPPHQRAGPGFFPGPRGGPPPFGGGEGGGGVLGEAAAPPPPGGTAGLQNLQPGGAGRGLPP